MSRAVCCRLFNLAGVQHSAKQGIENSKIVLLPWHRTEWAVCSMGLLANGIFVQVPRYFNKSSGCMLSNYTEPELNARMLDRLNFPGSSFVKKKLKSPKSVALVCQNKNSLEPFLVETLALKRIAYCYKTWCHRHRSTTPSRRSILTDKMKRASSARINTIRTQRAYVQKANMVFTKGQPFSGDTGQHKRESWLCQSCDWNYKVYRTDISVHFLSLNFLQRHQTQTNSSSFPPNF